jgi:hypothetical protein
MSYCALDEAFLGPPEGLPAVKSRHKKQRAKDVPAPLPDSPEPSDKIGDEIMLSPPTGPVNRLKGQDSNAFFPLPGETDSWEKAFMMDSDFTKTLQRQPVAGEPTLWRQIPQTLPVPPTVQATPTTVWSDVNKRLDTLTKQLDSLTSTANAQSTAELFLFIAIGLLLLLFVDTLLRYAATIKAKIHPSYQSGGMRRAFRDTLGRFRRH